MPGISPVFSYFFFLFLKIEFRAERFRKKKYFDAPFSDVNEASETEDTITSVASDVAILVKVCIVYYIFDIDTAMVKSNVGTLQTEQYSRIRAMNNLKKLSI